MEHLTDWIQIALTVLGGGYALFLFRQSNKDKRNTFISNIYTKFYEDAEIREIIYCVDRNKETHEIKYQGKLERQADKTLKYLDYLGYLLKERQIRSGDINSFRYEINKILKNKNVIKYIYWLKNVGVNLEHLKYLKKINDEMKIFPNCDTCKKSKNSDWVYKCDECSKRYCSQCANSACCKDCNRTYKGLMNTTTLGYVKINTQ